MITENTTFSNFNQLCGYRNYIFASNQKNDDGQHPVTVKNIKLNNVDEASKIWIHRPNLDKITTWDCIDMDCDALKKNLLTDLDGSFIGSPGSVISQSEFEWGSQQRGLGDFRIPKEALAAPNGSMLPIKDVYTYRGIVRDENLCTYRNNWQGYECHSIEYKMLIIESMDPDTLHRRLSPIAIISDNKYLDLINGPQDHGCCFGYTCLKRISTFMAIVSANRSYDIYLTSTAPKQLRFRILNADSSFKIRLSMHYFTSNRIDVYKNATFVDPTNAVYSNGKLTLKDTISNLDSYMPHYLNASGTNLAVRSHSKVYFAISGPDYIDLKVSPLLFVKFGVPAITEDSFFNPANLVRNFAALFGIDESMIRQVSIVRESGTRKRRQSSQLSFINLTIFENPVTSLSNEAQIESVNNTLKNLSAAIINRYTTGELQVSFKAIMGVDLEAMFVQKPNSNGTDAEINKVNKIRVVQEASECREQSPCGIQPILMILNQNVKFE